MLTVRLKSSLSSVALSVSSRENLCECLSQPAGRDGYFSGLPSGATEVEGLDLNPAAVEFCNARMRRHGFDDIAFVADMSNFKLSRKCDVAFNTINSFRHLDSESAALSHLTSMGHAVRTGGLYLLGVHLTPSTVEPSEGEAWAARRGHLSVTTKMWTNSRNPKTRVERFGIRFDIHSPSKSFRIEDELVLRSYTFRQMDKLIRDSKVWETVATYDFGYDLNDPVQVDASSEDVVYVFKTSTSQVSNIVRFQAATCDQLPQVSETHAGCFLPRPIVTATTAMTRLTSPIPPVIKALFFHLAFSAALMW